MRVDLSVACILNLLPFLYLDISNVSVESSKESEMFILIEVPVGLEPWRTRFNLWYTLEKTQHCAVRIQVLFKDSVRK